MKISIIVANDEEGGIGKDGKLPWCNKADLKHFSLTTQGNGNNAVIMGRNTWRSLPNPPLANRTNLVLSTTMQEEEGCKVVKNVEEAIAVAEELGVEELWVIGGRQTYEAFEATGRVNKYVITKIEGVYDCDVWYRSDTQDFWILAWHKIEGGEVTEWIRYMDEPS
jgi:dihydrofolate reductase